MRKLSISAYPIILLVVIVALEYGVYQHPEVVTPSVQESTTKKYQIISALKAKHLIDNIEERDVTILDVRSTEEYTEEHIRGGIVIPLQWLQEGGADHLNKEHTILVYCETGDRSLSASQFLSENNFTTIYTLEGGILAWKNEDLPTVTKTDKRCDCR